MSESRRQGCLKDSLERRISASLSSQVVCFMIKGKDLDLGFDCATYKLFDDIQMLWTSPAPTEQYN